MNRDVQLRLEGALTEKLIGRAMEQGAVFARIQKDGARRMIVNADPRSAAILSGLCEKYGYPCRQVYRGGATAMLERLRSRWTLLPGLLLGAVICALALSRIWLVEIAFTGENAHLGSRDAILACLEDSGISIGMYRGDVNADLLKKEILAKVPGCSHIGVKLQGTRLLVEASPAAPEPQLYQRAYIRDLVARQDGVVERIDVYSGQACVSAGDTVRRGQVLIRGEENVSKDAETGDMITAPVGALGEVIARCWVEGSAAADLVSAKQIRTGRLSTACEIRLMNFSLPISEGETYESMQQEIKALPIVGLFLPLEIWRTTNYETRQIAAEADPEALAALLKPLARADALRKIEADEYEIAHHWTDIQQIDNTLHIRAVYEIYTDIAAERDALIEEVY